MMTDPGAPGEVAPGAWSAPAVATDVRWHPGRLALGFAAITAERLRPGAPSSSAVVLSVGLAQQAANEVRSIAWRAFGPPWRLASRTLGWASARMSESGRLSGPRARLSDAVDEAKHRGETALAAGRADATAFLQAGVAEGIAWAQERAVPQIVDGLVPHLVDTVVPRIIDGVMPDVRTHVLPVVIDDLANDPRVRDLVLEQSRGVIDDAAQHVHTATAEADDRVEATFRRLVGRSRTTAGTNDATDAAGARGSGARGATGADTPTGSTHSPAGDASASGSPARDTPADHDR